MCLRCVFVCIIDAHFCGVCFAMGRVVFSLQCALQGQLLVRCMFEYRLQDWYGKIIGCGALYKRKARKRWPAAQAPFS